MKFENENVNRNRENRKSSSSVCIWRGKEVSIITRMADKQKILCKSQFGNYEL